MNGYVCKEEQEERILLLAPTGSQGELSRIVTNAGLNCLECQEMAELCREVEAGAGAVVLTEEAFRTNAFTCLADQVRRQPPWSDLPILLVIQGGAGSPMAVQAVETLGNVVLLADPVHVSGLQSALRAALRARRRQYQIRGHLEEKERLQLATEASGVGVWAWDLRTGEQKWDERCRALLGLPPGKEVSYAAWLAAVHPEDRPLLEERTRVLLASGPGPEEFRREYRVVWPDGSIRWLLAHGRTHFAGKQPLRMAGIVLDITAMKEAEAALRQAKEAADSANRAKNEFLANMSHEIRTPLTVTMGTLELLQTTPLSAEQLQYLEMARASSAALLRLIEDLLDFSRIEAGLMSFQDEFFDLRACVEGAVAGFRLEAQRKGLQLTVNFASALPRIVRSDPDRLRQLLFNLIGNAVKFTPRGEVSVQVTLDRGGGEEGPGQFLIFSVRDTGIGVPPEKKDRLFKTFSQVDASLTRRYGGTGLGLALSKRIAERLGGTIWMESEPGRGSVFSFSIPLQLPAAPQTTAARAAEAADNPETSGPACILLAEDEPMVREMISMILRNRGLHVVLAENGREALAHWEKSGCDLILMDVQMPEMDGLEATRVIREREKVSGRHMPIIALTAHARTEDREKCREAGMDDYLAKPVQMQALYAAIERHLGGAGQASGD